MATWLMMSVEGPFISAIIARMAEPKYNLAAYGVAFSFALIVEAPVIMLMSASTALVKNKITFKKLRNFTYFLNFLITLLMLIMIIPPVFYFITRDLIDLPDNVVHLTHLACIILLPWPGTIGYRRFYQGILIKNNLTKRVAYGTVIRLSSMALTGMTFYLFFDVHGVVVGAAALSVGVTMEALASKLMVVGTLKKVYNDNSSNETITYKEIYNFYLPLALTSMLTLGVHPMVTFFIGQSRMALESLAILPVLNSLVFIFRSIGLSFQEVPIALLGESFEGYKELKKFGVVMGTAVVIIFGVITLTPLSTIWYHNVSGLSMELTNFASVPTIIMTLMPGLTFLISFQRAILVAARSTKPITAATAMEVIGIIGILFILTNLLDFVGVIAATTAFITGRLMANIYLVSPYTKIVKTKN
ncbi:MAG: hypothetical protein PVH88_19730 [Ignavibacteria bacterium]|jgi:hypothetical protein